MTALNHDEACLEPGVMRPTFDRMPFSGTLFLDVIYDGRGFLEVPCFHLPFLSPLSLP